MSTNYDLPRVCTFGYSHAKCEQLQHALSYRRVFKGALHPPPPPNTQCLTICFVLIVEINNACVRAAYS